MFNSPITIGLSPNTESDDVWISVKTIFTPWSWKNGNELNRVEEWFKNYFSSSEVFLFNSGRSALIAVLKSFDIGLGDEVLIQAFTCVAVPDPVIWQGAKPIFVDIDETLNIDPKLLEKHINKKTKAIVVQHTFGIGAEIKLIKKIAQKYNLILIEDCAHALGANVDGQLLGTFGDAAIFSFGRDKVISSVFGGMAMISGKRKVESGKLKEFHKSLSQPSYFWIFQQLLHPIIFALILPLYNVIIGKIILLLLLKIKFLSRPVYKEELIGGKPNMFPAKYPNALARLLLRQLNKLDYYNKTRRKIVSYYFDKLKDHKNISLPVSHNGAIYLRFNVLTPISSEILKKAKAKGILLGNWYRNVVDPKDVDYDKIGYKLNSCPNAEDMAKLSVNLPTYPRLTEGDLERVVKLFE